MILEQIDINRVPRHVAVIMDGNGRWAKKKDLDRSLGHKEGIEAVHNTIQAASNLNIPYLTLYTFSTENWNRPKEEVEALMALIVYAIAKETEEMIRQNVRINVIGDLNRLPDHAREALDNCMLQTAACTKITVTLALSYSSKWEITQAMKRIGKDLFDKKISCDDITENLVASYLLTNNLPDPELLIRTGAEKRISNFLLWQIAYAELYFTETLWPDFGEKDFQKAILDFQARERRFGKTSEQITDK